MGELDGKIAVVTGATSGMGRAIAVRFAAAGAAVVLAGRDRDRGHGVEAEIASNGGRAEFVPGDLAEPAANRELVARAVEAFGGVDILVANAGTLGLGSITEVPLETWRRTLAINLDAVFHLMRYGIPELQERGGGTIVVNGSIAARKGFPNHAAYCASKGALPALVRQAALDYAPDIRVNLLETGPVDTPLIWESAAAFPDPAKAVAETASRVRLARLGRPEDIAEAALFLAGPRSSWMTGACLLIDGGITS